jgi:hypothetical protein
MSDKPALQPPPQEIEGLIERLNEAATTVFGLSASECRQIASALRTLSTRSQPQEIVGYRYRWHPAGVWYYITDKKYIPEEFKGEIQTLALLPTRSPPQEHQFIPSAPWSETECGVCGEHMSAHGKPLENIRGLTQDKALLEAIEPGRTEHSEIMREIMGEDYDELD